MKRFRKAAAALLAMVMAFGLMAACGDESGADPSASGGQDTPDYIYVADYATLSGDLKISYINNCCYYDGQLYFTAQITDGTESYTDPGTGESYTYDTYRTALLTAAEDGTGVTELTGYVLPAIPEGMAGNASINYMTVDPEGNLWVFESLYIYTPEPVDSGDGTVGAEAKVKTMAASVATASDVAIPAPGGSYENSQQYFVRKLDKTGAEISSVNLDFLQAGSADANSYFYINSFQVDGQGNVYLNVSNDKNGEIDVLDGTGTLLFTLTSDSGWINNMTCTGDGSIAVSVYDDTAGKMMLKPVDIAAKSFGEGVPAPVNAWNFYPGGADYDLYYNTDASFFGYKMDTGESTKLFTWINCDVDNGNIGSIMALPDGRILCSSTEYNNADGSSTTEFITMTKTPSSEVQKKTVLTYACMYLDWNLRSEIIKFNKTNSQYRIEVQDYSEYNTDEDYTAGLTKLSTEIISGKVPDILDTNSLPISQYAAKGLLEDLWPYIDADTELGGRDALMTPVFDALTKDGKLYQVTPGFTVFTAAGAPALVGDTPGWTLDDLYAALGQLPEGAEVFSMGTTKDTVLSMVCSMGLDGFVNWETGECTFDSPEFIDLLKFTDLFPATFDWNNFNYDEDYESDYSRLQAGKQLLVNIYASDFQSLQMYEVMFGGGVTFVGFPTQEGGNGSAFQLSGGLAMSSACQYKDGAWAFIRTLLSEDYQTTNSWQFPTNKKAFDAKLKDAMTPQYTTDPETGEQVEQSRGSWGWGNDLTVDMYAMTQAEADQIMALINGTTRIYSYDEKLMGIITEETAAYFSGQKTAEVTAAAIQSRVNIYVNEQR